MGVITLNAPRSLNALSAEMAHAVLHQFQQWRGDADIAAVILQGAGDRAFCAGGDIVALYKCLARADANTDRDVVDYFELEYRLDYAIHMYPKPILCWGHGVVMGGGLGLMAGASHRVVTETSRIAMPEIAIGLYPDVGASWFLNRMPGRVGLYLGLTGSAVNAADALFLKLADHRVRNEDRQQLFDEMLRIAWDNSARLNAQRLSALLRSYNGRSPLPPSPVRERLDLINAAMDYDSVEEIGAALTGLAGTDPWLQRGAQSFHAGSPTSAKVIFEIYRRATRMSLKEVFAMELGLTIQFARHPDLQQGIRALLIDKDNRPRWSPATLADVSERLVEEHLTSPWPKKNHPFHDW